MTHPTVKKTGKTNADKENSNGTDEVEMVVLTREQAYDQVRREFYALRQREEVEKRIAQEEARMVGAYFGASFLDIGFELENREYANWTKWAVGEAAKADAVASEAYTSFDNPRAVAESASHTDADEMDEAGVLP